MGIRLVSWVSRLHHKDVCVDLLASGVGRFRKCKLLAALRLDVHGEGCRHEAVVSGRASFQGEPRQAQGYE